MTITRDRIVANTYQWPDGSVPYDMERPDGTLDCSSYVARCLELPTPDSWSTVNLPRVCTKITPGELRRGDLIGKMGPGTSGGDGHVMVFLGWAARRLYIAEQTPDYGPTHREMAAIPTGYECWRFNAVSDMDPALIDRSVEIINKVNDGVATLADGSTVCPVVWRQNDEKWQAWATDTLRSILAIVEDLRTHLETDPVPPVGGVPDHQHDPGGVTR